MLHVIEASEKEGVLTAIRGFRPISSQIRPLLAARSLMRSVLSLQPQLGASDIGAIQLDPQSRDDIPAVLQGLQCVYCDPACRAELFALLEQHVLPGTDRSVGRPGMDLWQVLVMGLLKQGVNCDFDRLTELVNNPIQVRQMLGLGAAGFDCGQFHLQTVIGNVALLSADLLEQVNRVLVAAGHAVAGHEPGTSLAGRCASFAVETDVHYPTDVNLLWDAVRCLIAVASAACAEVGLGGWRKRVALQLRLQALFNKVRRTRQAKPAAVRAYLAFCQRLVERAGGQLPDLQRAVEAERVAGLLGHARWQIDQVSRRLLKGERIPHAEKVFSVFEEHTRWVSKGKAGCPVELGVPVCIVEDQQQFVVGWEIEWCGGDTDVAVPLVRACQQAYPELRSCSFDKGFHSPANRAALDGLLGLNALPRKGRLSGKDKEREGAEEFVQARQQHPAVESAINNLERRGLDRVRTHGKAGFERTVALAVTAANLHRIGLLLQRRARKALRRAA